MKRNILREGHVYTFSNISCIPAVQYRPVMRAERLRFNALTIVRQDDQFRGIMRRHHFEYQDYHVVASRLNKDTLLTDLIGAVTKI